MADNDPMTIAHLLIQIATMLHDPCGADREIWYLMCQDIVFQINAKKIDPNEEEDGGVWTFPIDQEASRRCQLGIRDMCRYRHSEKPSKP